MSGTTLPTHIKAPHSANLGEAEQQQGHYNPITKRYETDPDQNRVSAVQDGSTMPEDIGEPTQKTSFMDAVKGNAKKFAGQTFGKQHEVAQGEALLSGQGVDGAIQAGEAAKADA